MRDITDNSSITPKINSDFLLYTTVLKPLGIEPDSKDIQEIKKVVKKAYEDPFVKTKFQTRTLSSAPKNRGNGR